jgi:hypothetical protein
MAKRKEVITRDSLSGLIRHHPYLLILQKEDWQDYLLLLAEIFDILEQKSTRVPIDVVRPVILRFYSGSELVSPEQKATSFLNMAIAELQVLKDSHDQFGQRYLETTRAGKALLQLFEGLVSQRGKFSGTGAETLLGALNDILIARKEMTEDEAMHHHREKIAAYKEDLARIKANGLAAAQLLPMAHSNEALFAQAEEAAIHVIESIEDVKAAIEAQRKELAAVYFSRQRSAGETLGAVADFYSSLYLSPAYASYIQAKDLLSHLEGFQARFAERNVDRLLRVIDEREKLPGDFLQRSNLSSFMRQFSMADDSIQEKIKEQIRILQQQVLYAISNDVEGTRESLHQLISGLMQRGHQGMDFFENHPVVMNLPEEFEPGPVDLFGFELPVDYMSEELAEESLDEAQERELMLALLRAEEGTLKDMLQRLRSYLQTEGELRASRYVFARGLSEYYVLSAAELFDPDIVREELDMLNLEVLTKHGSFILRGVRDFVLRMAENG